MGTVSQWVIKGKESFPTVVRGRQDSRTTVREVAVLEDGARKPRAEACGWSLEAGKGKTMDALLKPPG